MALEDVALVDMYVNPLTGNCVKITFLSPFGLAVREHADWQPTNWDDSGVHDLDDHRVYRLDWDTDFVPMDSDEEEREHKAIQLFDEGKLTETECEKYGVLRIDPANSAVSIEPGDSAQNFDSANQKICPNCYQPLKTAWYGMLPPDNLEAVIIMGDVLDEKLATFGCKKCGYLLYEDGTFKNSNA